MNRRLMIAVGLLVVILLLVGLAVYSRSHSTQPEPQPQPSPTSTPVGTPNQATLLVAVRDDNSQITDAVVHGAVRRSGAVPIGSWLSLQPGLAIAVNATGSVTLAQRGPFSPSDVGNELANELGFDVDGAMVLDRLAFAALVDAVGGVTVDVKVPIVEIDADGTTTVLIRSGQRTLFGPAAAQYVITLNPGEPQGDRMARFDDVWAQVILKLPGNEDKVRGIIGSLGSLSRLSATAEDISRSLLDAQTSLTARTMSTGQPTAVVSGVGPLAVYTSVPGQTQPTVLALFSPSLLVPGVDGVLPRVRVSAAGSGYAAIAQAQVEMRAANLSLVWGAHLPAIEQTAIFVPNQDQQELGEELAKLLGVPAGRVQVAPDRCVGVQAAVWLADDSVFASPSASASGGTTAATGTANQ